MFNNRELRNRLVELKRQCKYYSLFAPTYQQRMFIHMVDGRFYHGGMADRFKGMVSLYAYCKAMNFPFRIYHVNPFDLRNYLKPNLYDWQLRTNEFVSYNFFSSRPVILAQEAIGRRLFHLQGKKQYHVYYNRDCLNSINNRFGKSYKWGELFYELFAPTPPLAEAIEQSRKILGNDYISVVFRFQRLLGDFDEGNFLILPSKKQEHLIETCLQALKKLLKKHDGKKCLITSDSMRFLQSAQQVDGCFVIPGKLTHMAFTNDNDFTLHLKSFVDFFMLSKSKKIYSVGTPEMYKTEFPLYAACVNEVPFERILLPPIL